jgi:hypothetical protein
MTVERLRLADFRRCLRMHEWLLLLFLAAQAAASKAEGQQASIPIYSLLMQINADAVCLVRTQFQHVMCAQDSVWRSLAPKVSGLRRLRRDEGSRLRFNLSYRFAF